jgi:hypothetical protein
MNGQHVMLSLPQASGQRFIVINTALLAIATVVLAIILCIHY